MQNKLMEILACPRCLGTLELKDALFETGKGGITKGRLCCERCGLNFHIEDSIPIFGIRAENKAEREGEMDGEIKWEFTTAIQSHMDWAKTSSHAGERMTKKIKGRFLENSKLPHKLRVLDVGAGVGAFHSWQFSKHGFEVVATELCPEFLFSIDYLTKDMCFDRVVTDCTILPFRDTSFDVVFCKELIHHMENPIVLLSEIWRVLRPNGLIAIEEPCISILRDKNKALKKDSAARMGITHHYYTYNEYISYMKKIASNIEIGGEIRIINSSNHPVLSKIQKCIIGQDKSEQSSCFKKFLLKMQLIFIGGSVELIGVKRREYMQEEYNREVIPIAIERLNLNAGQMEFYKKELIPLILKLFSETHEKYLADERKKKTKGGRSP